MTLQRREHYAYVLCNYLNYFRSQLPYVLILVSTAVNITSNRNFEILIHPLLTEKVYNIYKQKNIFIEGFRAFKMIRLTYTFCRNIRVRLVDVFFAVVVAFSSFSCPSNSVFGIANKRLCLRLASFLYKTLGGDRTS